MSGTELIMGMGEVINYLKELEEKNKKLEEENKDLNFSLAGAREVRKRLDHAIKKLEEENKKLKRANEINSELHKTMEETINQFQESDKHLNKCIDSIRDQYLELKEEINGDGFLKQGYKTELSNSHKQQNRMVKEIKKLKEENKNLAPVTVVVKNEELQSLIAEQEKEIEELKSNLDYDPEEAEIVSKDYIKKLKQYQPKGSQIDPEGLHDYMKEEIDKLKEENERLRKTVSDATLERIRALDDVMELNEEKKKLKNKLNVSEINRTEAESELESFQNFTRDFDYEDNYNDWLKGNHDDYSGSWLDNWYSEHFDKYEDGEDWDESCGYTIKDGEYRICMAGGGDHWYDYVMTKEGCFIHNKEGKKKVFTFVSCPNANYIKVWDTPDMEGGLVLDEGETDLYEMVKESYEEIMNFTSD